MAGYIKVKTEKLEVQPINIKINAKALEEFQKKCKRYNLQMCTVIETFARQYANGRYVLKKEDILKWKNNDDETATLNTPINKEVHRAFKEKVKANGYFVKYVLTAFVEDYANKDMVMEFVSVAETKGILETTSVKDIEIVSEE